jgi:peptide chain release factor 2
MPAVWAGVFDVAGKEKRAAEIEALMGAPSFWGDRVAADKAIEELGEHRDLLERFHNIEKKIADLRAEFDEDAFHELKRQFRDLELRTLFTDPHDSGAAVIGIYPGAGGEDAEDWAIMLFRMYEGYAKQRGWKTNVIDDNIRNCALEIKGPYAYGYLKREMGVHRLVRISPFSSKKLRHTSFALVEVLPDLPPMETAKMEIPEKDLKIEFSRGGGPGGQNVNKVETAVRIVHLPTGLVAGSRAERSQVQNREKAMSLLKAKLLQLMEKTQAKELGELRTSVKPEWGNQIRSYVLNPYQMVKDHRTDIETARVDEVLAGNLDEFIEAELEGMV